MVGMGMRMGISLGQELRLTQRLAQRLTLAQRLRVQEQALAIRLELVGTLREEEYKPEATCPDCSRKMTSAEIVRGFSRDPKDFTTCCSGCGCRFEPHLVCFGDGSRVELPFYCNCQTLDQLPGKENLPPAELARLHPGVYRSAIIHHGGVRSAFEKMGINYPFEEISDWRNKIQPFLGRLPDTTIASCVHTSARVISIMRKKAGVSRFTIKKALEEADEKA